MAKVKITAREQNAEGKWIKTSLEIPDDQLDGITMKEAKSIVRKACHKWAMDLKFDFGYIPITKEVV